MPAGKYSFYLHPDDRSDVAAAATLETISQPLRGEFLRTAAVAGSVLYRIDCRLPALVTELFDGQLRVGQFCCLLGAISGQYQTESGPDLLRPVIATGPVTEERRRFNLQLQDDPGSELTAEILENLPSRVRGQQLRNLLIAGFALHTMDRRFPRLLASLPVPPGTVGELRELTAQITGITVATEPRIPACNLQTESESVPVIREFPDPDTQLVRNMKKLF